MNVHSTATCNFAFWDMISDLNLVKDTGLRVINR